LCASIGHPEWSADPRFATNPARVVNRGALEELLTEAFSARDAEDWVRSLRAAGLPCAPINNVDEAFRHEQVRALNVVEEIEHPAVGTVPLVRSPLHLSDTPPIIRHPPPTLGQHTEEVLGEVLGLSGIKIDELRRLGAV
jgi:succinate--hydroxymethylglutarate CoA-transferase